MQVSANPEYDYSDSRDASKTGDEVKEKGTKLKPVKNHFYSVLCRCKKDSPLFLHLQYKTDYQNKEAGRAYRGELWNLDSKAMQRQSGDHRRN